MQGKPNKVKVKVVLEPLNFANDRVRCCYVVMVEREIRRLAGHIICKCVIWWTAGSPYFVGRKSDGVVASHDFLKVLLEGEFGVESDS